MSETGVRVSIINSGSGGGSGGYAAYLEDLSLEPANPDAPRRRSFIAPIGGSALLECAPGRYRITAYPPSGGALIKDVEVRLGETAEADLRGLAPSADWLEWQAVSGAIALNKVGRVIRRPSGWRWALFGFLAIAVLALCVGLYALRVMGSAPMTQIVTEDASVTEASAWAEDERAGGNIDFAIPEPPLADVSAADRANYEANLSEGDPAYYDQGSDFVLGRAEHGYDPALAFDYPVVANADDSKGSLIALGAFATFLLIMFFSTGGLRRIFGLPEREVAAAPGDFWRDVAETPAALRTAVASNYEHVQDWAHRTPLDRLAPGTALILLLPNACDAWRTLAHATQRPKTLFGLPGLEHRALQSTRKDDGHTLFLLDESPFPGSDARRSLLVTPLGRGRFALSVLPAPWTLTTGRAALDVNVTHEGDEACVSVVPRDKRFNTLIGYLATGDLQSARSVIDHDLRDDDGRLTGVENPFAAAAIGYALMGSAGPEDDVAPWCLWARQVQQKFNASSDLAVVAAWAGLLAEGEDVIPVAGGLFKHAFANGPPAFSEGVRRLRNGLLTFKSKERKPANDAPTDIAHMDEHELVETVLRRCRPRHAFTTIELGP